jgi:TetR/AcrR family transcriptional regulator
MTSFQRARQPDQINLRRKALLAAAAELFDAEGPWGAGLNAIAARARFTKSNVYRDFESREDVLLALLLDEFDRLSDAIEKAISARPVGDIAAVAEAITTCFLAQPRCCHLMSIFASVLEQNVSEKTIEAVKRHLKTRNDVIVAALMNRLPGAEPEDCGWAITMTSALVAGMWAGRPSFRGGGNRAGQARIRPHASAARTRPKTGDCSAAGRYFLDRRSCLAANFARSLPALATDFCDGRVAAFHPRRSHIVRTNCASGFWG